MRPTELLPRAIWCIWPSAPLRTPRAPTLKGYLASYFRRAPLFQHHFVGRLQHILSESRKIPYYYKLQIHVFPLYTLPPYLSVSTIASFKYVTTIKVSRRRGLLRILRRLHICSHPQGNRHSRRRVLPFDGASPTQHHLQQTSDTNTTPYQMATHIL